MAKLTLARKIAAITLILWKKGERFDPEHLKIQSSLSAKALPTGLHVGIGSSVSERSGSRVSIHRRDKGACFGTKLHGAPYAPSDNPTKL